MSVTPLLDLLFLLIYKIDEAYNHKVKIFWYATQSLENMFIAQPDGESNEKFAIKRAISRLNEMQTLSYFNQKHSKDISSNLST